MTPSSKMKDKVSMSSKLKQVLLYDTTLPLALWAKGCSAAINEIAVRVRSLMPWKMLR